MCRNQLPIPIAINTNEGSVNWPIVVVCASVLFCWNALKTAVKKAASVGGRKASSPNKKVLPTKNNNKVNRIMSKKLTPLTSKTVH